MPTLSRRHLVTTAAALPALALPAAVLPAAALPAAAAPAIDSREAMVIRAQQMVDLLGTCYVREGWKLDAERAALFVESVRTFDENDGDCPKFRIVLDWMHDHGQSLDWLADGDIAGLITARAVLRATVGVPTEAYIKALCDAAMKADEAHGAACKAVERPEEAMFEWRDKNPNPAKPTTQYNPKGAWHPATGNWFDIERGPNIPFKMEEVALFEKSDDTANQEHKAAVARRRRRERAAERRTGYADAKAAEEAACDVAFEAYRALRNARPLTLAGLVAKARVAAHIKHSELEDSLVQDIEALSPGAVQS
jgi:hypothetical protein